MRKHPTQAAAASLLLRGGPCPHAAASGAGVFKSTRPCSAAAPPPPPLHRGARGSSKAPPPPPLVSSTTATNALGTPSGGKPKTPPRLPGIGSGLGGASPSSADPWGTPSGGQSGAFSEGFGGAGQAHFRAGFGSAEQTSQNRFSKVKSWGLAEKALGGFQGGDNSKQRDAKFTKGAWGAARNGRGGTSNGFSGRKGFNPSWKQKYMDGDDDNTSSRGGSGGDGTALSAKAILYQLQHTMDQFKKVFGKEHVMVECSPLRRPFVLGYVSWAWQNNFDIIFDQKSSALKKKDNGRGSSSTANYQPTVINPDVDIDDNMLPTTDANNLAMKKAMVATLRMLTNGGELSPEQGLAAFKAQCAGDETYKKVVELMDTLDLSLRASFHLARDGNGGGAQEWRIHCKVHLLDPYSSSGSLTHETLDEEVQRRDEDGSLPETIPGSHGYAVCARTLGTSSMAAPQGLYRLLMRTLNEHLVPYLTEAAAYCRAETAHEAELMLKSLGRGGFGGFNPHLGNDDIADHSTHDATLANSDVPGGGFYFNRTIYDGPQDIVGSYAGSNTFLGRNVSQQLPPLFSRGAGSIEGCGLGGLDKVKLVAVRRSLFPTSAVPSEVQHPLEGSTFSEMSLIVGFRLKYLDDYGNVTSLHYVNTSPLLMSATLMQSLHQCYERTAGGDEDAMDEAGDADYSRGSKNGNRRGGAWHSSSHRKRPTVDPVVYPALSEDALFAIGWHPSQLPPMHHDEVDLVATHLRIEALQEAITAFCREPHLALSVRESVPPTTLLCSQANRRVASATQFPDYGGKLLPYLGADAVTVFATQQWFEVDFAKQHVQHREELSKLGVEQGLPSAANDPTPWAAGGAVVDNCDAADIAAIKQTYEATHLVVPQHSAPFPHLYTAELQRLAHHRHGPEWLPPHRYDRAEGLGYAQDVTTSWDSGTGSAGYSLFSQFAALGVTPNSTTLQLSLPCLLHADRPIYTVRSIIGLHGAGVSDSRARAHVKKLRIENRSMDEAFDRYLARVREGLREVAEQSSARRGGRSASDIPGYMVAEASIMWSALNSATFDGERSEAVASLTTGADVVIVEPAVQSRYAAALGRYLVNPAQLAASTSDAREVLTYVNSATSSVLLLSESDGDKSAQDPTADPQQATVVTVAKRSGPLPETATYAAIPFKGIHNLFAVSSPNLNENWSGLYSPARRGLILASLSSPKMGMGQKDAPASSGVKTGGTTVSVVNLKACLDATGCSFLYDARRDLYVLRGSPAAREQQCKAAKDGGGDEEGGSSADRLDVEVEEPELFGGSVELFAGRTLNGLVEVLVQVMGVQSPTDLPSHTFVYSSKKKKRKAFGRVPEDSSQARKPEGAATDTANKDALTSEDAKPATEGSASEASSSADDEFEDFIHFTTRHLFKCASKVATGEEVMLVQANIQSSPKLRSRSGIVNVLATTFGQDSSPTPSFSTESESDANILLAQSASKRVVQVGVQQAVKMALGDVDAPQQLGQAIIVCGFSEEHSMDHVFKEAYERFLLPICVGPLPLHLLNQINPSLVEAEAASDGTGRRAQSDDFFDGLSLVANPYAGRPCRFLEHPTTTELPLLSVQREELVEVVVEEAGDVAVPPEEMEKDAADDEHAEVPLSTGTTAAVQPAETATGSYRLTKAAPPLPLPAKPSATVRYASKQTKLQRRWITVAHQVHPETLLGTYFFLHDRCPTTTQDLINLKVGVDITPRTIPHFLTFRSLMKRLLGPKGFPQYHPSRCQLGQLDLEVSTMSHRSYCDWEVAVNNSLRGRVKLCTSLCDEGLSVSPDSDEQDRSRLHGELGREWPYLKGELASVLHETSLLHERHVSKTVVAEVAAMKMLLKHFPTTYEAVFSFNHIGSIIFNQSTCDAFGWDDPAFHFGRSRQTTNQVTCTFSGTNLKRSDMVAAQKEKGTGRPQPFTLTASAPNYFKALTRCVDSLLSHIGTSKPEALVAALSSTGTEAGILGSSASHLAASGHQNVSSNVMQSLSAGVQVSSGGVIMGNYTPGDDFSGSLREGYMVVHDNIAHRKRVAAVAHPPADVVPTPSPSDAAARTEGFVATVAPIEEDIGSVDLQQSTEGSTPFVKRARSQPVRSAVVDDVDGGAVMDLQAEDDAVSPQPIPDEDPDLQGLPVMRNESLPHEDEESGVWGVEVDEDAPSGAATGSVRFGGIGASAVRTPIGGMRNVMNDEDDEEAAMAFGGVGSALSYQQLSGVGGVSGRNSPGGIDELVPLLDQLHYALMEQMPSCLSFHTTIAPSTQQGGMFDLALVGLNAEDAEETIRTAACNGEGILIAIFELYESAVGVEKYRKIIHDLNRRASRHRSLEGSMFKIRRYISKQVRLSDNDIQYNHSDRIGWSATLTLPLAAFGFLASQVGSSSISVSSSVKRTKKDATAEIVEKLVEATSVDIRSQAGDTYKGGTLGASSGAGSGIGSSVRAAPGTTPQTRAPGFLLSPARKYPSLIEAAVHIASGRMRRRFPNGSLVLRVVNDELEEKMSDRQVLIAAKKIERGSGNLEPMGTELHIFNPDAANEEERLQLVWRSPSVSLVTILQGYISVGDYFASEHDRNIIDIVNNHRRHWAPAAAGAKSTSTIIQANQLALKRYFGWNVVSEGDNVVMSRSLSISIGNPNTSEMDPFMATSAIPSALPAASNSATTQLGETTFDDEFLGGSLPKTMGAVPIGMDKDPKLSRMLQWADVPDKWWTTVYDMPRWHCYFCIGGTPIATANGAKKKDAFFAASVATAAGLYEPSDLRLPEAEWLLKPSVILCREHLCGIAADGRGGANNAVTDSLSRGTQTWASSSSPPSSSSSSPHADISLPSELMTDIERQRQRFQSRLQQRNQSQERHQRTARFHKADGSTPRPSLL